MGSHNCEICFSKNVHRTQIRIGLEYLICSSCGHCVQFEDTKSIENIYKESQMKYYSDDSNEFELRLNPFDLERKIKYQNLFNRFIDIPSKVLEVGIGDGAFSEWLHKCGHDVCIIEESKKLGRLFKKQNNLIPVIIDEFENCSIPDESFDVFCSFHVIEHVLDPVLFLTKAFHVTRVGGLAFIATPNSTSWQQRFFRRLSPNYDIAHLRVFSQESLKEIAKNTGWSIISEKTPEYTSSWLRILSKVLRKIKGEDEEKTAGKYMTYSESRYFFFFAKILQSITSPLRFIQECLYGGNETFFVLQRNKDL